MRKYTLADGDSRVIVDLRDYEGIIVGAVQEFAPGTTVVVSKDHYTVKEPLTQSQAVRIGRRICESDLSRYCIKLSKLFNSRPVKEEQNDQTKEHKHHGGHH